MRDEGAENEEEEEDEEKAPEKRKREAWADMHDDDDSKDVDMNEVKAEDLAVNLEDEGDEMYSESWEAEAEELDEEKVAEARSEEVGFMHGIGVWKASTAAECWEKTGKPPVTTKWVDVNKGRDGEVIVRSRLVARDFRVKGDSRQFEVFAAMPPIEAKRLLFRMAMMSGAIGGNERRGVVKLLFIDIKKGPPQRQA